MSRASPKVEQVIPDSDSFRAWLSEVLPMIGSNAYRLAKDAKVAVNSCQKFLKGEQDDLRLTTASHLHAEVLRQAKSKGVKLPDLKPGAFGRASPINGATE